MEARIIGPAAELGPIPEEGLNFQGIVLTRQWSTIRPNAEQRAKLEGNRFVEIKGDKTKDTDPAAGKSGGDGEADLLRARLVELGVDVPEKVSLKTLQGLVEKAEKAQAAAEAEAEEAAAAAEAAATAGNGQA